MPSDIMSKTELPDGSVVVIYDYMNPEFRHGRNMYKLDAHGEIQWRANPPQTSGDAFVHLDYSYGVLTANSASGFLMLIDIDNGEIVSRTFTK